MIGVLNDCIQSTYEYGDVANEIRNGCQQKKKRGDEGSALLTRRDAEVYRNS